MAVGFDAKVAAQWTGGDPDANLTATITIGSNSNRVLYAVGYALSNTNAVHTIGAFAGGGGGTWTRVAQLTSTPGLGTELSIWRSIGPATGAQTITWARIDGNNNAIDVCLVSLYNVSQSAPEQGTASNTGTDASPTVTITSTSGNYVLDIAAEITDTSTFGGTGFGTVLDSRETAGNISTAASRAAATGNMASTWTVSIAGAWSDLAVSVAAEAILKVSGVSSAGGIGRVAGVAWANIKKVAGVSA